MTSVREYLKTRKNRKADRPKINYRERIRSHKLTIFYRVLLGAVLVTAIGALLIYQWKNRSFTQSGIISSITVQKAADASYKRLGNNILVYSKDGASCLDSKGTVLWNRTYEMQNPIIEINGSVVAIGDYNGRVIYIMNEEGNLGEVTTNLPIRKFCVSAKGIVAVILDDGEVARMNVYDSQGNELVKSKATMNKTGYPLDISLSPSGELFAVSYLYVDSGVMRTSIAFHNFGTVGQNQQDNFVSGYNYLNAVVPEIQFLSNNTVFALADDRLMFFKGDQKPLSEAEIILGEQVQSVYYGENYVGLVFLSTQGAEKYRLDVYQTSGKLVMSTGFDIEYTDILFHDNQVLIYNDIEYSLTNMDGVERFRDQFPEPVYLLTPAGKGNRYVVMTQNALNIMEIK